MTYNHILGVRGLDPKENTRQYWIVKRWEKEARIDIDDFIEKKLDSYETYMAKVLGQQIADQVIATKHYMSDTELVQYVENYLKTKNLKFTYTFLFVEVIALNLEYKLKKYIKQAKTLDEHFGWDGEEESQR